MPCDARETISLRDSTYITSANQKKKRGDKNYQGEIEAASGLLTLSGGEAPKLDIMVNSPSYATVVAHRPK